MSDHVAWSFVFLVVNCACLWFISFLKNRKPGPSPVPGPLPGRLSANLRIDPKEILAREYEYAKVTASEAMADRQSMINFYLILVGVVASGVLSNLDKFESWQGAATTLVWSVCAVGWVLFLTVVRLREAWRDSGKTMLHIRDFCIQHADNVDPAILIQGFPWRRETLPAANKPWSVFFYSALLIGFLDSVAFVVGGILLGPELHTASTGSSLFLMFLGVLFFAFHISMYYALLPDRP